MVTMAPQGAANTNSLLVRPDCDRLFVPTFSRVSAARSGGQGRPEGPPRSGSALPAASPALGCRHSGQGVSAPAITPCEVHVIMRPAGEPRLDLGRLVGGVVVHDD